ERNLVGRFRGILHRITRNPPRRHACALGRLVWAGWSGPRSYQPRRERLEPWDLRLRQESQTTGQIESKLRIPSIYCRPCERYLHVQKSTVVPQAQSPKSQGPRPKAQVSSLPTILSATLTL